MEEFTSPTAKRNLARVTEDNIWNLVSILLSVIDRFESPIGGG
jgi:hypothetical protein